MRLVTTDHNKLNNYVMYYINQYLLTLPLRHICKHKQTKSTFIKPRNDTNRGCLTMKYTNLCFDIESVCFIGSTVNIFIKMLFF